MGLSKKTLELIRRNNKILGLLVGAFDVHFRTMENWIENNDIRLTTPTATKIIMTETGLNESEIYENEDQPA